jgi:hypothetical protein
MTKNHGMMTQMFGYCADGISDEDIVETFVHIMINGIRPGRPQQNGNKK